MKGFSDGVGLDHGPYKTHGKHHQKGENRRQQPPAQAGEGGLDVIDRSAGDGAVHFPPEFLGQYRFAKGGSHAEKGADPHPEHCSRAAHGNGRCGPRQIAGAHLSGYSGHQGAEGAHAILGGLLGKGSLEHLAAGGEKAPQLHKAEAESAKHPGAPQSQKKEGVPQKGADFVKLLPEQIHFQSLAFLFSQKSL